MRRIKIMGLCLVAVFAFSAIGVSAAQAGEYGVCKKIPETAAKADQGKWEDKNCTKAAVLPYSETVGHDGEYEWFPGITAHTASAAGGYGSNVSLGYFNFTDKTGTAVLSTPALGGKVTCTASTSTGKITAPTEDRDTVTFTGCETEGKKCASAGQAAGTIKTNLLKTDVIDEPGPVVKIKFTAAGAPVPPDPNAEQAEFECEGLKIRTHGFTEGTDTKNVNVMNTISEQTFANEENLETEVNSAATGNTWVGPFKSEENTTGTTTGKKIEIKT
jgi:hypothetical protein